MRFWFTLWLGASRHLRAFRGLLRFRVVRTVMMARLFGRPWRIPAETAIGDMQHFAASALEEALAAGRGLRFRGGHHIAEPITVAWSSRDPLLAAGRCPLDELPTHTRSVMLRGCGHVPTWNDPPLVLETIRATAAQARPPSQQGVPARMMTPTVTPPPSVVVLRTGPHGGCLAHAPAGSGRAPTRGIGPAAPPIVTACPGTGPNGRGVVSGCKAPRFRLPTPSPLSASPGQQPVSSTDTPASSDDHFRSREHVRA